MTCGVEFRPKYVISGKSVRREASSKYPGRAKVVESYGQVLQSATEAPDELCCGSQVGS